MNRKKLSKEIQEYIMSLTETKFMIENTTNKELTGKETSQLIAENTVNFIKRSEKCFTKKELK